MGLSSFTQHGSIACVIVYRNCQKRDRFFFLSICMWVKMLTSCTRVLGFDSQLQLLTSASYWYRLLETPVMAHAIGLLAHMWETGIEFLISSFSLVQLRLLLKWPVDRRSLYLILNFFKRKFCFWHFLASKEMGIHLWLCECCSRTQLHLLGSPKRRMGYRRRVPYHLFEHQNQKWWYCETTLVPGGVGVRGQCPRRTQAHKHIPVIFCGGGGCWNDHLVWIWPACAVKIDLSSSQLPHN